MATIYTNLFNPVQLREREREGGGGGRENKRINVYTD